jgi:MFS family permease
MVVTVVGMALEATLYSVMVPLLTHYTDELRLSRAGAGILIASYTAGMLPGSFLGGWLAGRIGARATVLLGFGLLCSCGIVVGAAGGIVLLDAARLVQGLGAGLVWSGLLTWLIGASPEGRRGEMIGIAFGAATFGTLLGPVVGTVATAVGPFAVFAVLSGLAAAMMAWALTLPDPPRAEGRPQMTLAAALRRPSLLVAVGLALVPGLVFGFLNVLIPLRLSEVGAGVIGGTFLGAALVSSATSPLFGRLSDRVGRLPVMQVGLCLMVPALVVLAIVRPPWLIATMVVVASAVLALYIAPALTLLTEAAEELGVAPGSGASLVNVVIAAGETVGAPLGATTAQATSDGAPFLLLAAVCGVVLVVVCMQANRT